MLSHNGKIASFFLPYKAWTNDWRVPTTKPTFDLSLLKSTANRLDYLYEISHVPEDSKIHITDFPIVNPYTVFDKPQVSFKKSIKNC